MVALQNFYNLKITFSLIFKVLELPNSVYNPTTTGFTRMSASSFSSKSSFTSNEEEA